MVLRLRMNRKNDAPCQCTKGNALCDLPGTGILHPSVPGTRFLSSLWGVCRGTWILFCLLAFSLSPSLSSLRADEGAERAAGASEAARQAAASRQASAIPVERLFRTALEREEEGEDGAEDALAIYRAALRNGATGMVGEEAWLGVARCEHRLGNHWRAFLASEQSFPSQYDARRVSERLALQIRIAEALEAQGAALVAGGEGDGDGKKRSGFEAASRIYERIVYNDPQHPFAARALLRAGDCYLEIGDLDQAEMKYRQVMTHYERSEEMQLARLSLAKVLSLKHPRTGHDGVRSEVSELLPPPEMGASLPDEVRERAEAALAVHNQAEAESLFEKARYYASTGGRRGRDAAIFLCEDILKRYPDTPSAAEAQALLDTLNARSGRTP